MLVISKPDQSASLIMTKCDGIMIRYDEGIFKNLNQSQERMSHG